MQKCLVAFCVIFIFKRLISGVECSFKLPRVREINFLQFIVEPALITFQVLVAAPTPLSDVINSSIADTSDDFNSFYFYEVSFVLIINDKIYGFVLMNKPLI